MIKQTAGRDQLGAFAPEFAHLNDDILFGEVWSREGALTLRDRSLITVSTLLGRGVVDASLKYHLATARKNGVSKEAMAELLTHVAFYAGWPMAWAAFDLAKEVYADAENENHGGFFGLGEPNTGYAKYFTGRSWLKRVTPEGAALPIFNVTFEPGCRNAWHRHNAKSGGGQRLICVDGFGWYQAQGEAPRALKAGDVVDIPANTWHWHGATKDAWFSHLAFELPGEGLSTDWAEALSDEDYAQLKVTQ